MAISIPPADPHRSTLYWGADGLPAAVSTGQPVIFLGPGDAAAVLALAECPPDMGRVVCLQRLSAAGVAAWARLTGAIPPKTWPLYQDQLTELARLDAGQRPRHATSDPGYPRSVTDSPLWGPLALHCLAVQGDQRTNPGNWGSYAADLLDELLRALTGAASGARDEWRRTTKKVTEWVAAGGVQIMGGIAVASVPPQGGGLWPALYAASPVGVIATLAPGGRCHYSVAFDPHRQGGAEFTEALLHELKLMEPGWGGSGTITGSPKPDGSALALRDVVDACRMARGC